MKIRIDNKIKLIKYKQSIKSSKSDLIFIKDEFLIPYLSFVKKNKSVYKAARTYPNLFKTDVYSKKVYKDVICAIFDRFETNDKIKNYILIGVIIIVICRFKRWKSWLKDWFLMIENLTDNYKFIKIKTL